MSMSSRRVCLLTDEKGNVPTIVPADFDVAAWFVWHVAIFMLPLVPTRAEEDKLHLLLRYHCAHLPCSCRVSAKTILTAAPPPFGAGRDQWWLWSIKYHNFVRNSISLPSVDSEEATRQWNAKLSGKTTDVKEVALITHDAIADRTACTLLFWHVILQTCWTFGPPPTPEGRELTRDYLRLLVEHMPCKETSVAALAYFLRKPPPISGSRDDVWDWGCAFHHEMTSKSTEWSADDTTTHWNAVFSRSRVIKPAIDPAVLQNLIDEFLLYATLVGAEVVDSAYPTTGEE